MDGFLTKGEWFFCSRGKRWIQEMVMEVAKGRGGWKREGEGKGRPHGIERGKGEFARGVTREERKKQENKLP